jgi:hypothetical protein
VMAMGKLKERKKYGGGYIKAAGTRTGRDRKPEKQLMRDVEPIAEREKTED